MKFLAQIISTLLEPMLILGAMVLYEGLHVGLKNEALFAYTSFVVVVFCVIAAVRFHIMRKGHTNWDVSDRKKRVQLLISLFVVNVLFVWIATLWQNAELTQFFFAYFAWFIGFFFITLFMKLSGHIAVTTIAVALFIKWFGPIAYPSVLVLPLLAWSRLALKRHSVVEVVVGMCYSVLFIMGMQILVAP